MSQEPVSSGTQPLPIEDDRKMVIVVKKFPRLIHKTLSLVAWVLPFVMLAVGYYFFDALSQPITWPWNAPAQVWGPLFFVFIIIFGWLCFEMFYATHRNTSVLQLQADDAISLFGAIILSTIGGALIHAGRMEWWFLLPWLGSIFDAFMSGYFAINNAAQKPFVPTKGAS